LFSILGTKFGGDGTTNFGLPNLQERAVVGVGQGTGLSAYAIGQAGGSETFPLTIDHIPAHTHAVSYTIQQDAATEATTAIPTNNTYGTDNAGTSPYTSPANIGLKPFAGNIVMDNAGTGELPAPMVTPYLALNYIICLTGAYPAKE
jgi:microcystin-dependent protein